MKTPIRRLSIRDSLVLALNLLPANHPPISGASGPVKKWTNGMIMQIKVIPKPMNAHLIIIAADLSSLLLIC